MSSHPWKRRVEIGDCTLYEGDCLEVMPLLGKVDAVVTSPPYDNLREYGDGYAGVDCFAVIRCIASCLADGGVCMWNVADATVDGSETGTSFRQALHAMEHGLNLHDTMIYCREGVTFPNKNRYLPCFEYMFVWSKGRPRTFNGIFDRPNKWAKSKMHGTDRQPNGKTTKISQHGKPIPNFGLRRNWWVLSNPYVGETNGHPAPMPYSMADGHIRTWSNLDETILDPFMGSGTTLVACAKLGRKGIGIELDPDYFDIACERVRKAYEQPDLFIQRAEDDAKQETFDWMQGRAG